RSKRCMDKSVTPVSCKGATYDGYFMKHPDDCNLFYYCATPQSEAVCVECPNNQQFNAKRRACDAPYRANCNLILSYSQLAILNLKLPELNVWQLAGFNPARNVIYLLAESYSGLRKRVGTPSPIAPSARAGYWLDRRVKHTLTETVLPDPHGR
ncbi:hypothetical protein KGM_211666B, partial [Danaus plexippus plexippus]